MEQQLQRIGRLLDYHGLCLATMVQLTGGAFLTGYLLTLGSSRIVIGVAAALPLLVKLSQLYTSWRIERHGRWNRTALHGALMGRVPLLLAGLIPLIAYLEGAEWILIAIVGISALGGAIWEIAFLTWMAELIPARNRGSFWGKRSRISEMTGLVVALAAAFLFDQWQAGRSDSLDGYALIFAVGALAGSIGILFLRRVPVPENPHVKQVPSALLSSLSRPARDPAFRRVLLFVACWGFTVGYIAPFTAVYMLQELHLSLLSVTFFTTVPMAMIALTQASWGRLGDHFGSKPVIWTASFLIVAATGLWLVSGPAAVWPLVILQIVNGTGWSAYHVGMNNLMLKLAPPESRSSYVASVGVAYAVSQAVSPVLGGLTLTLLTSGGISSLNSYYILFAAALLLRLISLPLLGRIIEPGGAPVGHMIRVLGRFRTMGSTPGAEFLYGYAYTHLARIADFITREKKSA